MSEQTLVDSFAELWSKIGGGTKFTIEDFESMMVDQEQDRKPLTVIHREKVFVLSLAAIADYFRNRERPKKAMSTTEENKFLKKELEEAKKALAALRGTQVSSENTLEFETDIIPAETPDIAETPGLVDKNEKPETFEDIQKRLAEELKGSVPKFHIKK